MNDRVAHTGEQLTKKESARLQQKLEEINGRKNASGMMIAMGVLVTLFPLFCSVFAPVILFLILFIFLPITVATLWLGCRENNKCSDLERAVEEDLNTNQKEFVEGVIEKKEEYHYRRHSSYSFWLQDKKYEVGVTFFTRFDIGDTVRLILSQKARVVIGAEGITEGA